MDKLLEIRDLTIHFIMHDGVVEAVNHVSLDIGRGETLGLVGETGAGKTTTALGIMNLVPKPPGKIMSGEILFEGKDLLKFSRKQMYDIRGNKISMIFQDPMTSLNPIDTVGAQISEGIRLHNKISRKEAQKIASQMLEMVGIDARRYNDYPHEFSGGMKQRVVIAMALACHPDLMIADEPTTALDVTIQAQVLDLMRDLRKKFGTSILMISHDLGVVSEICDKVAIMYAGSIIEYGPLREVFRTPAHPYTKGLLSSIPSLTRKVRRLTPIPGQMPDPMALPDGCRFADRCPYAQSACRTGSMPVVSVSENHWVKCCRAGQLSEGAEKE